VNESRRHVLKRTIECLLLAPLVLFASVVFAQSSGLRISAPSEAKGDGVTPIHVQVDLGSTRPGEAEGLQVEVSAGRIVSKKETTPGSVQVALVPPRVAEAAVLSVAFQIRGQHAKSQVRLLPTIARSETRASNGPLDLQAPERMILGYDHEATVTFSASAGPAVSLYASAGTISTPKRDQNNRLKAIYTPPAEKLPRVVLIVAAAADGSMVDYVPIRLYGYPLISTLSEPHATVLTRVAGEIYGPFQADRRGRVELRVLVPPGVTEAQTVAQDALHNERTVTLKLGISSVHEAFALCPAASETLFYFAVDAGGLPRKELSIQADSTLGKLSPLQFVQGRYYMSPLTLPPEATLGQPVRLTAQIEHEQDSKVVCDTTVAGEAPARLQLSVAPDTWVVGSGQPARVDIQAFFKGKRTPRAVTMLGSTDFGELSAIESQGAEHSTATWTFPANLAGRREAKLQVKTVGPRPASAELVVQLRPGPPVLVRSAAQPGNLKSDGHSTANLVVEVRDANGNPVDAVPEVMHAKGTVSRFTKASTGVYSATYRAPRASTLDHDDVSVRIGSSSVISSVRIELTPNSEHVRLWGTIGYGTNFAKVRGLAAAAGGSIRLPIFRERLNLGADVGYLASDVSELDAAGQEVVSIKTTVVPLTARATYEIRLSDFGPYLGVAAGVAMVRSELASPSSGRFTQWNKRPAFAGMLGTSWRWGPGSLLAEVAYRFISLNEPNIAGNVGGFSIMAGYAYDF
jgi:hypothetical protein